jgi:hypothetical protein
VSYGQAQVTAASEFQRDREALTRAAENVRWWPAALAFVIIGVAYSFVSDRLTVGPNWVLLVIAVLATASASVMRWRGNIYAGRWIAIGALGVTTLSLSASVVYLVSALLTKSLDPTALLEGGGLLWVANIATFGLWYWEVDGGGPAHRHLTHCGSSDFAFPQMIIGDGKAVDWMPDFLDYVFLAFNTSTAFSPTDTMVLARRAKVLMMYQSVISLVTVAVLVARAINNL